MTRTLRFLLSSAMLVPGTTLEIRADEPTDTADTTSASVAVTESAVTVKDGTWDDVTALLQQNLGKVVVVDLWSTSCRPCVKEFPELIALHQKLGDQLVCVSLNLDYAGIRSKPVTYYRPRVEAFLQETNADIHNFISTQDALTVMDELKVNSIPVVYVYGKDGKLVKRFDDSLLEDGEEEAFTYQADINPLIEQLLK